MNRLLLARRTALALTSVSIAYSVVSQTRPPRFPSVDSRLSESTFVSPAVLITKTAHCDDAPMQDLDRLVNEALESSLRAEYNEAAELYTRAIAILKLSSSKDDTRMAKALNGVGTVYVNLAQYDLAEAAFKDALKLQHVDPVESAMTLFLLGVLYQAKRQLDVAEPLFQDALAKLKTCMPDDHPRVIQVRVVLAGVYEEQGDYDRALRLCQGTLPVLVRLHGRDYIGVAGLLNTMSLMHTAKGELAPAKILLEEAIDICQRSSECSQQPGVALWMHNLARVIAALGDQEGANRLGKESVSILERTLGHEHPKTKELREVWH